jgi:hypothetical protein
MLGRRCRLAPRRSPQRPEPVTLITLAGGRSPAASRWPVARRPSPVAPESTSRSPRVVPAPRWPLASQCRRSHESPTWLSRSAVATAPPQHAGRARPPPVTPCSQRAHTCTKIHSRRAGRIATCLARFRVAAAPSQPTARTPRAGARCWEWRICPSRCAVALSAAARARAAGSHVHENSLPPCRPRVDACVETPTRCCAETRTPPPRVWGGMALGRVLRSRSRWRCRPPHASQSPLQNPHEKRSR